jgi:CRP-like cAMP-binding protein
VEAIYSLFGWVEGSFQFLEGPVSRDPVIKQSRMEIVLEAMRMLDDGVTKPVGKAFSRDDTAGVQDESGSRSGRPTVIKGPFVDYMYVVDEDAFRDGTTIVAEGGYGNWIWVILEGMALVTREVSNGVLELARLGEGCFIGTIISFIERSYKRNVTVTAMGDIQVGVLDSQRLYQEYVSLPVDLRSLILSMDRRLQKITNRAAVLFEKNDNGLVLPEKKNVILKQGGAQKGAYTITRGNAYLVREMPSGDRPLMSLEEGDVFGNIPFITGLEPHQATVVGSEDLEITELDIDALHRDYKKLPVIFKHLVEGVCTCVSVTAGLASNL